jgi:hypothetical protein
MDFPEVLVGVIPHAKIAAASLAGGVVRLFLRPARDLLQTGLLLASCVTCGYFGQPVVSRLMGLPQDFDGAVGALLGLVGVSLASAALKAADKFDVLEWLSKRTP